MGGADGAHQIPHAAGRRPAGRPAARPALIIGARHSSGAHTLFADGA
ncbi:MAG: hypothetical protein EPO10_09160 [Reyranella sp.]|nr:MAG: hypothetical protein EPO41_23610 [Reyranella sp.]TBR29196.1 MAG: hypothetical protein EPO10_09160 [Reyranella sp.]